MILEIKDVYEDIKRSEKVVEIGVLKPSYMLPRDNIMVNRYRVVFRVCFDTEAEIDTNASHLLDEIVQTINTHTQPKEVEHLNDLLSMLRDNHNIQLDSNNIDTAINNIYEKYNKGG